jgi:tyrosine-specific transport protein
MLKTLAAIGLVSGTAIGGGMLALPVVTASYGLLNTTLLFISIWLSNTFIALLFLEVNLWLQPGNSLISMAKQTLGKTGTMITWCIGCLFLYSLLVAYISGLSDATQKILTSTIKFNIPAWFITSSISIFLSILAISGTNWAASINRLLFIMMIIVLGITVAYIFPHIDLNQLTSKPSQWQLAAFPVVFTSFGYMIIIPTIREYLKSDIRLLKISLWVGGAIPLLIYLVWIFLVFSTIPLQGHAGLQDLLKQDNPGSGLIQAISTYLKQSTLTVIMRIFVLFAIATSSIGSLLGLVDMLSDGTGIKKNIFGRIQLALISLIPPWLASLYFKQIFITALGYAGIFSVILLAVLPALMVWVGRYQKNMPSKFHVFGGRYLLIYVFLFSALIIWAELTNIAQDIL